MALLTPGLGLIFWTLLVFLIVLFILRRAAWKPILETLKKREDDIDDALQTAEKAREEIKRLKQEQQDREQEARLKEEKIIKDAKSIADKIVTESKTSAREEGNKILENARMQIEKEKTEAMREVKTQVAQMVVEATTRILKERLEDSAQQEKLIENYLEDIKMN